MRLARDLHPVREVVVVGVGVVEEAALFHHQAPGIGTEAAGVPPERPAARHPGEAVDGEADVLALHGFLDELVIDPAPAVAHDLVARFDDGRRRLRVALEGHADREDADLDSALGEHPHQAPEADTAAVLVDRLDLQIPHARQRLGADDLLEKGLGLAVTVKDRALAAFLVVHHDLERQAGPVRPLRIRGSRSVADQISRVGHRCASSTRRLLDEVRLGGDARGRRRGPTKQISITRAGGPGKTRVRISRVRSNSRRDEPSPRRDSSGNLA